MTSNRREFLVRSTLAVAAGALGSARLFAQQPAAGAPAPPTVPVFASLRRNVGTDLLERKRPAPREPQAFTGLPTRLAAADESNPQFPATRQPNRV